MVPAWLSKQAIAVKTICLARNLESRAANASQGSEQTSSVANRTVSQKPSIYASVFASRWRGLAYSCFKQPLSAS
jgi:hypothetical protein